MQQSVSCLCIAKYTNEGLSCSCYNTTAGTCKGQSLVYFFPSRTGYSLIYVFLSSETTSRTFQLKDIANNGFHSIEIVYRSYHVQIIRWFMNLPLKRQLTEIVSCRGYSPIYEFLSIEAADSLLRVLIQGNPKFMK